jgi:hypothetical protein
MSINTKDFLLYGKDMIIDYSKNQKINIGEFSFENNSENEVIFQINRVEIEINGRINALNVLDVFSLDSEISLGLNGIIVGPKSNLNFLISFSEKSDSFTFTDNIYVRISIKMNKIELSASSKIKFARHPRGNK